MASASPPLYEYDVKWESRVPWSIRGRTRHEAKCSYCCSFINIRDEGLGGLLAHGDSETHNFIMNCKLDREAATQHRTVLGTITPISPLTQRAEILWCLGVAAAVSDLAPAYGMFETLFPDSKIAKQVVMSKSKVKYIINKGIRPYLIRQLLDPIKQKRTWFVLDLVETGGFLEIYIRYWNDKVGKVLSVVVDSCTIDKNDQNVVLSSCLKALRKAGVPLGKLVHISTPPLGNFDEVLKGVEEAVIKEGGRELLRTQPFDESVIHHVYRKTLLAVSDWGLEDLVFDLVLWFASDSPVEAPFRRLLEEFSDRTGGHGCVLSTLRRNPMALNKWFKKISANWTCLVTYFTNFVPNSQRGIRKCPRFQRLSSSLTNPVTMVRMWFLRSIGERLEQFLQECFPVGEQERGTSVHLVYKSSSSLIKDIGECFLKRRLSISRDCGVSHVKYEEREHQLDTMYTGDPPQSLLRDIPTLKLVVFDTKVRDTYAVLFGTLAQHLPLTDRVWRGCKLLNPEIRITRKDYRKDLKDLVGAVSHVVGGISYQKVLEEWNEYQSSDFPGIESCTDNVEIYWDRILQTRTREGMPKFCSLSKLVKVLLCLVYNTSGSHDCGSHDNSRRPAYQITRQYLDLIPAARITDIPVTDELVSVYQETSRRYHDAERMDHDAQADSLSGSCEVVDLGGNNSACIGAAQSRYSEIKDIEALLVQGFRLLNEGLACASEVKVSSGMSVIKEGRVKLRELRTRLTNRDHIRDLDENNRLLLAGLYAVERSRQSGRDYDGRTSLSIIKWGCEGVSDLKLDLRAEFGDSSLAPLDQSKTEDGRTDIGEDLPRDSGCSGCFRD